MPSTIEAGWKADILKHNYRPHVMTYTFLVGSIFSLCSAACHSTATNEIHLMRTSCTAVLSSFNADFFAASLFTIGSYIMLLDLHWPVSSTEPETRRADGKLSASGPPLHIVKKKTKNKKTVKKA